MADEYKAQGNAAFSAKDYESAIKYFTLAIEASETPNHVLYSNRSASYASLKKYRQALEDAKACTEINPSWAKGFNRVGAAHHGLSDLEDAKVAYKKALELEPGNKMAAEGLKLVEQDVEARTAMPDMGLGKIFSDPNLISNLRNNPKTADLMEDPLLVEKIQRLKSNPQAMAGEFMSDPRLMTIMATLMGIDLTSEEPLPHNMEEEPKAAPKANPAPPKAAPAAAPAPEAMEVDSDKVSADALKAEGNTLYKARKFDEAIAKYTAAWETHQDITYLNNRAAAEFEKGDYEAAIATCTQAVDAGREARADYKLVAKSFARLGQSYLKQGNHSKAIEFFNKSLTEHRTPDVLNKLRAAEKDMKVQEALNYIDPEQAEAARLEGKEYFTKGDWPNAVKAYTEMIKRAPEDARGYSNRAAAYAKLLAFPDAVRDCDIAIAKDPAFIRAYIRKATAQLAMREFSPAMETLTVARELDSKAGGKSVHEIDQLYSKVMSQRFSAIEGETPEQTMERVSRDPEVTAILQDPVMNSILGQARDNPAALQDHMRNPDIAKKVNILIAAGVIRTR